MMQQIQETILLQSVEPNLGIPLTNLRKLYQELWADLTFSSILSFLPLLFKFCPFPLLFNHFLFNHI